MSALHAAVINTFKSQNWAYRAVPNMEVIEADFEAHHGKMLIHLQSYAEAHILSVVATASSQVTASHTYRAAELLMRANKELNLGNFEMDWDSGMVMYRQSNIFPSHRYDEQLIAGLVHTAITEMDRMTALLGELLKTRKEMLALLSIKDLLLREDLLPLVPEETGS